MKSSFRNILSDLYVAKNNTLLAFLYLIPVNVPYLTEKTIQKVLFRDIFYLTTSLRRLYSN